MYLNDVAYKYPTKYSTGKNNTGYKQGFPKEVLQGQQRLVQFRHWKTAFASLKYIVRVQYLVRMERTEDGGGRIFGSIIVGVLARSRHTWRDSKPALTARYNNTHLASTHHTTHSVANAAESDLTRTSLQGHIYICKPQINESLSFHKLETMLSCLFLH